MKFDFGQVEQMTKKLAKKYGKQALSIAVAGSMIFICAATMVHKYEEKHTAEGVMIALSDVSITEDAFSGNTFLMTALSYEDMQNLVYEEEQLAKLEKTEKQVEEVLTSGKQDKKDMIAVNELTATVQTSATTTVVDTASTVVNVPTVEPTYADENGTFTYLGTYTLSAYCPCPKCCGAYSNMDNPTTASGAPAVAGVTIAAPSNIPFGTMLSINGQIYTVQDRGGAISGNRLDVFFSTHEDAWNFGLQSAEVYIYTPN